MIKKSIILFICLFFIFQFSFSEVLNFNKNVINKDNFIFKPIKLLKIIESNKNDNSFKKNYFLLGENDTFKNVAINLTLRDIVKNTDIDPTVFNGIIINGKRMIIRELLLQKLLSTIYVIKLKNTKIVDTDFIKISITNSSKILYILNDKYKIDYILDIYCRSDYIFNCIEPIECEDSITYEELNLTGS